MSITYLERITNPSFIEPQANNRYYLNTSKLSPDECHLFFPVEDNEELLLCTALEYLTFHPDTQLNKKFNITLLQVNDIQFFWCSFPKEFKEVCKKTAQIFNMQMLHIPMSMSSTSKTKIRFPRAYHLLVPVGPRSHNPTYIRQECKAIQDIGDSLQCLDID